MKNEKLELIIKECQSTGAWFGIQINDLSDRNIINDTPLHTVCSWGELDSVKEVVLAGADVNARGDGGSTPLFSAIISGDVRIVNFLIESGADKNIQNDWGRKPIDYAINISAPTDVIKALKK